MDWRSPLTRRMERLRRELQERIRRFRETSDPGWLVEAVIIEQPEAEQSAPSAGIPDDLIPTSLALKRFNVCKKTLTRARDAGKIACYLPEGAKKNATLFWSEAELAQRYPRK